MELYNSTILVTGGAGSIGSALIEKLLKLNPKLIRILDNNEYALYKLQRKLSNPRLHFMLGDVRDKQRVEEALDGIQIVYHLAAIKHIDIAARNPLETIKTNIDGTMNLILSCLKLNPHHFFFISTDKAVNPSSLYGCTKAVGEHLTLWANQFSNVTRFTCIRFGNVKQTSGNVFEIWQSQLDAGKPLTVTHPKVTRYFMDMEQAIRFITDISVNASGGEIFITDMKKYKILDLAKELSDNIKIINLRPNEKLHELLMTKIEKKKAKRFMGKYWVIK